MSGENLSVNGVNDEIDLKELFTVLWLNKIKIISISLVFAFGSVIYALSLPNKYTATVTLAPAQGDGSGLSSNLGQIGGFSSITGFSLARPAVAGESQIAQEIMKSRSFIETFIDENDLAVQVYATEGWSKGSNELQIDEDVYDVEVDKWLIKDAVGKFGPPSGWNLFQKFSRMLAISENKNTGLVSISIQYYSPNIAKEWLDMYVASINKHMQSRQIAKVSNNIDYLEAQINKTSIAEMREVFYTIIEEQTKNKMVAEASPDYVFVAVSPSMVPAVKSQPKRALLCIVGTLVGAILSVFLVLIRHYLIGYGQN